MQESDQSSTVASPIIGITTTDSGKNIFQFPKAVTTQNNNRNKHEENYDTNSESEPPKFSSQQQIFFDLLSSAENVNLDFSHHQTLALSGFTNMRESSSLPIQTRENKLISTAQKNGKITTMSSSNSENNNKNGHHHHHQHSPLFRVEFLNDKTDLLNCDVKDVLIFGKNNRQVSGYLKKQAFVKLRKEMNKKESGNQSNDNEENIPAHDHEDNRDEMKQKNGKKHISIKNRHETSALLSASLSSTLCSNNWFELFPQHHHHNQVRRQRDAENEREIIFCTLENYDHRSTEPSSTNVVARRAKLFGKPGKQFELCQNGFASSPVVIAANDDDDDDEEVKVFYPRVLSKLYDDMVNQMDHFGIPRNHNVDNRILKKFLLAKNKKMNEMKEEKDDDLDLLLSIVESFEMDVENNSNGDSDEDGDDHNGSSSSEDNEAPERKNNQEIERNCFFGDNKCVQDLIGKLTRDSCLYSILQVVLRCISSGSSNNPPTLKIVTILPATVYDALGDGFYDDLPEWDMLANDFGNKTIEDTKTNNPKANTNKISDREESSIPWFEDSRARLLKHFFAAEKQQLGNTDATAVTLAKNNPYVVFGDEAAGQGDADDEDSDESRNRRNEMMMNFEQVVNEEDVENYFEQFYCGRDQNELEGDENSQSSNDDHAEKSNKKKKKKKITSKKSKQREKKPENQLGTFNPIFVQRRSNEHSLDVVVEVSHNNNNNNNNYNNETNYSVEVRVPLDNFRIAFPQLVMDFLLEHTMLLPTTNYGMEYLVTSSNNNNNNNNNKKK